MNVAGCDPSTSRIGWAGTDGSLYSISAKAKADENARRLHELVSAVDRTMALRPPWPDVIAVEGYIESFGGGTLAKIRLGEIGGSLRLRWFEQGIPYVEIRPGTLKRFATGSGNADKERMVLAARKQGATPRNHDEADAFHLRRMARAAYGLISGQLEDYELDAISALVWPTVAPV